MIQRLYCKEKLDVGHSQDLKGKKNKTQYVQNMAGKFFPIMANNKEQE